MVEKADTARGLKGVQTPLLTWYDRERRVLPWREEPTPYRVWISEIMLQQTRVDTVLPYFERFMTRFPTLSALANADVDDVLTHWSGLGYYSRARNLHRCAGVIRDEYGGELPDTVSELLGLPGIGRYTAGAIASIAFQVSAPIVDGNVIRVLSRWVDLESDVTETKVKNLIWTWAAELVPQERAGDFNQALMELGALVCTPRSPHCTTCPMSSTCVALERGTVALRPVKPRRAKPKKVSIRAAVIRDASGVMLVLQRPHEGLFGGLWQFPQTEALGEAPSREVEDWLYKTTGLKVEIDGPYGRSSHTLSHRKMDMVVYPCSIGESGPSPTFDGYRGYRWVGEGELDSMGVGAVTRKMLASLPSHHRSEE